MEEILNQYGVVAYGIAILFGGITGVKYLPTRWATKYRFLALSLIVAALFVLLEVFVQKDFKPENATKYLLTYPVVAVCYQMFIKKIFVKWGLVDEEPKQPPYSAPNDNTAK